MRSDRILPVTIEEALQLVPLLRYEDIRELEGSGMNPLFALPFSVSVSDKAVKFLTSDGEVAGIAGVRADDNGHGVVWMLCTKAVSKMPIFLVREARKWLNSLADYKLLYNTADPRNMMHLKLLKMLGFKKICYVPTGPKALTYVEFAKIMPCVLPQ